MRTHASLLEGAITHKPLLLTDGPYMAPEPHRGKVAHPGLIPVIAEAVAKLHSVPVEDVFEQTRANARAVYGI